MPFIHLQLYSLLLQTSYLWVEKKFQRKQAKIVALKNWYNIRDAACVYTVARRAATDEFVFNCINAGVRLANKAIIDSGVLLRPKKDKKDKNAHKHGKRKQSSSRHGGANDHLQFFLTEFDSHDANGGDSVGTGGSGDSGDDDDTCFGPDGESDAGLSCCHLLLICVFEYLRWYDDCISYQGLV